MYCRPNGRMARPSQGRQGRAAGSEGTSCPGALERCRSKRPRPVQWCALIGISAALLTGCGSSSGAGSAAAVVTSPPRSERELIQPGIMLSGAAVYGDLVWTAGHLPEGVSAAAPIQEQVEQVLDNLERTLESASAGFDTLLKTNVYLLDWDDWEAFNQIYEARIGRPCGAPPRTTVDVDTAYRRRQVQIAVVGDTVEISIGEQLIRSHKAKHDRTREHGALANPGGRPHRINAA